MDARAPAPQTRTEHPRTFGHARALALPAIVHVRSRYDADPVRGTVDLWRCLRGWHRAMELAVIRGSRD